MGTKFDIKKRQRLLVEMLNRSEKPVTGSYLAQYFKVSRQIIVKDINALKDEGFEIVSTTRGYALKDRKYLEFKVKSKNHKKSEDIYNELKTIIECGGTVRDVEVEHPTYGGFSAKLNIGNECDLNEFMDKVNRNGFIQLSSLSDYHYHKVEVDTVDVIRNIERKLKEQGLLYED